mgnify:CR=1 FL=1
MRNYYVYLLASNQNGTLYIGVTNDLIRRVYEHKNKMVEGFSKKYSVDKLVWFERYNSIEDAIKREKQLKNWRRSWKVALIERDNSEWNDLYGLLLDSGSSPE